MPRYWLGGRWSGVSVTIVSSKAKSGGVPILPYDSGDSNIAIDASVSIRDE